MELYKALEIVFELASENALDPEDLALDDVLRAEAERQEAAFQEVALFMATCKEKPTFTYTVIGFHPNTNERYMETIQAENGGDAERKAAQKQPSVVVTGVVRGEFNSTASKSYITV